MKLVIDSNRLVAGVLKDSSSRELILSGRFEFYSPDQLVFEIKKYEDHLTEKGRLEHGQFDTILNALLDNIILVPYGEFKDEFEEAIRIMKDIDVKDAPFLAVGMALGLDGIWTEDRHFLGQDGLRVYATRDMMSMLRSGRRHL
jgi:predicted nucleic acid-binding protein